MKKCLISGSTGLIGRQLVALLRKKWKIYAPVREPLDETSEDIQYIRYDFTKERDVEGFPKVVDAVIHLVQSEHFREFPMYAEQIFKVNTTSTVRLLGYAQHAQARTFVLASTGGIYGHGDEGFREDEPITVKGDLGFYLGTKICAEVLAENYTPFMNIIILRFFFVYGPGQRPSMLIPRLVKAVHEGEPIILHGRDGLKINPTYVTDASSAICRSLELTESHKINIAGPEVLSLREIGQQIGEVVGKEPFFKVQEAIEPRHLVADIKKMSQLLTPPQVRFKEGIAKYIEDFQYG